MQNLSTEFSTTTNTTGEIGTHQSSTTKPNHIIRKRIGSTNYIVGIYFNSKAKESISDKILRLIKSDIANGA